MNKKIELGDVWQVIKSRFSIYLVLAAMVVIATIISPVFLSTRNITNIARQISVITIMAFAQTLVILAGMIDLSVGSVMALAGVLSVTAYVATGSLLTALAVGIIVGVLAAVVNGFFVTRLSVPPFIATLGMLTAARGIALLYTGGQNIYQIGDFVVLGQGRVFGLPTPIFFMIGVVILVWYLLNHTRLGRHIYAIGGNEEAARASGIKIGKVKMLTFMIAGALVGLSGVLFMSRVNAGLPNAGIGAELDTISIAVIGGTSITGGVGTAGGTLAGAFIIGILNNIMNLMGVQSYIQSVIRGLIIVLAVAYDTRARTRRKVQKAKKD
ncbi:ABC transporter permease [Spirochaeta africana]|uniref:Permease component of ribose/xylose/arabinose/galactoside ABC-type transporters n=1 Tax=Spirochaeta africana (strain ATCC 700263 / DSM 8902 / Z-7692) TaxID=889378 RepID=H9UG75_SPIAZ|nr:ABC transporter permease [Spirochaeta africana]AFG36518.1 permease component of ribose/xylose/arabinose/galactoside ABC-type transporters [Spirochaeta africana DSM 8902]